MCPILKGPKIYEYFHQLRYNPPIKSQSLERSPLTYVLYQIKEHSPIESLCKMI